MILPLHYCPGKGKDIPDTSPWPSCHNGPCSTGPHGNLPVVRSVTMAHFGRGKTSTEGSVDTLRCYLSQEALLD